MCVSECVTVYLCVCACVCDCVCDCVRVGLFVSIRGHEVYVKGIRFRDTQKHVPGVTGARRL